MSDEILAATPRCGQPVLGLRPRHGERGVRDRGRVAGAGELREFALSIRDPGIRAERPDVAFPSEHQGSGELGLRIFPEDLAEVLR
ncbi:MAG: hypothetical protein ACREFS_16470, partial [Acetobacteraceae bacterium]